MKKIYAMLAVVVLAALAFVGVRAMEQTSTPEAAKGTNAVQANAGQISSAPKDLNGKKALVVYFSYTGNTRALAEQVHRSVGGDIFELRPSMPYSTDYKTVESQGKKEVETGYHPPLAAKVENLASYDVIFVGTPIWWYTISPPVATFLAESELAGKTIVPFVTHGGYGAGHSMEDIKKLAPSSTVLGELSLRGSGIYAEREIEDWMKKSGVRK